MIRNQRNIALLFAVLFLQGMVFYSPVATLYRQESGLDLVQIGGIESFSLALMLLLELPWGWLADRLGHRRTIVLCAFVFAASKVVFWRAETFAAFLAERALLAVSLSGLSGCDSAFLFACCRDGGHRRAYALSQAVQTLGVLAASLSWPLWGGTYRLAALLTVGSYTAAALLTLGLAEPEGERAAQTRTAEPLSFAQAARRTLALAPVLLAFCLAEETGQSVTVFLSPLLYTRAGIPQQWFGALHAAMTAAGLLGGLSHRMSRRLGQRRAVSRPRRRRAGGHGPAGRTVPADAPVPVDPERARPPDGAGRPALLQRHAHGRGEHVSLPRLRGAGRPGRGTGAAAGRSLLRRRSGAVPGRRRPVRILKPAAALPVSPARRD